MRFFFVHYKALIIYNRVGKCGSRTVLSIIKSEFHSRLSNEIVEWTNNSFTFMDKTSKKYIRFYSDSKSTLGTSLTLSEELDIISKTTNETFPAFYARHMNFINYQQINSSLVPVYINLVRYPPDRFVSHFYYRRNGDNRSQKPMVEHLNFVS